MADEPEEKPIEVVKEEKKKKWEPPIIFDLQGVKNMEDPR